MCASTEATGRVGVAGRQLSSCSDDTADLESSPNGGFKVVEIQSFCFLLDFQNFFQVEGECRGKRLETRRASRDLKRY